MSVDIQRFRRWVRANPVLVSFIIGVSVLLLYQQSLGWNWDFAVYSMNGEYLVHGGDYIEWYRPPIAPLLMGLFMVFVPQWLAEYLFVLFTNLFFVYAVHRLSQTVAIDRVYLYLVAMTPAIIVNATLTGTELLSVAFLTLFVAEFRRPRAGLWIAGAILTRYTMGLFLPLVLFQGRFRRILKTTIMAAVPGGLWLGYNWHVLGDPFTSLANSYALNVMFRTLWEPISLLDLAAVTGIPLGVTAIYVLKTDTIDIDLRQPAVKAVLAAIFVLGVWSYATTPVKPLRYLFPLVVPLAVIGGAALQRLDVSESILWMLAGLFLIGGGALIQLQAPGPASQYEQAATEIGDCRAASNIWPLVSYAGAPAEPAASDIEVRDRLDRGYKVAIFHHAPNSPWEQPPDDLPVVYRDASVTVLGQQCLPPQRVNRTYLAFREQRLEADGQEVQYQPCRLLFGSACQYLGL